MEMKLGCYYEVDVYTTKESERLVRLPMYYGLSEEDRATVAQAVLGFWK